MSVEDKYLNETEFDNDDYFDQLDKQRTIKNHPAMPNKTAVITYDGKHSYVIELSNVTVVVMDEIEKLLKKIKCKVQHKGY